MFLDILSNSYEKESYEIIRGYYIIFAPGSGILRLNIACHARILHDLEDTMRTETEEIRDNLKYLSLLARDYPSQAAAASEIISTQALLKLPKGTEHFMSDLAR